jgi:uncharacterized damage-inducible protein DinB
MRQRSNLAVAPIREVLLEAWVVNDAINQIVLAQLDPRAWRAHPPGAADNSGRTIAAIVAHMHNIRRKWVRLSAPHLKLPARLDRSCAQEQARAALAQSARSCSVMLAQALDPGSRVRKFQRDGWARPWAAGGAMFAYMLTHESQHRGQVCMLARQLGFPLPNKVTSEMWCWERLWKQCGFAGPR